MRARCASHSARRAARLAFALPLVAAVTSSPPARAAARRIALIHADRDLTRSVDLALYPWDIAVVEIDDAPPDGNTPDAAAAARLIARRRGVDAVTWIARDGDSATLWFYDAASGTLHSHPLPRERATAVQPAPEDAAELAAVALTLKTLVRSTPWEARLPMVHRERTGPGWETRVELAALARFPSAGASGEPRLGLWISEWYGPPAWMWGAALGASAGLGSTYDDGTTHASVQDIDLRATLAARLRLAPRFALEPRLGGSAHVQRASVTTTSPFGTSNVTRLDPSLDAGLFFSWAATEGLAWSVGVEALEALRYQRWFVGRDAVFSPSSLWIQAGMSLAWSFR